jgi:hypothetical protein
MFAKDQTHMPALPSCVVLGGGGNLFEQHRRQAFPTHGAVGVAGVLVNGHELVDESRYLGRQLNVRLDRGGLIVTTVILSPV